MEQPKLFIPGTTLEIAEDSTVSWKQLRDFFGAEFEGFDEWMRGQTCTSKGAYFWDVGNYIKGSRDITD